MNQAIASSEIASWIEAREWQQAFDDGCIAAGERLMKSRLVAQVEASFLETGDLEITARVSEKDGQVFAPTLILWRESGGLAFETECDCSMRSHCQHAAALIYWLAKGNGARIASILGEGSVAEDATAERLLRPPSLPAIVPETEDLPESDQRQARFLLRVHRRQDGERSAWLPEFYAEAFAYYEGHPVSLEPSGILSPIVLPDRKIKRDRPSEMDQIKLLYQLDLRPGAEEAPPSLKKLARPETEGTLWAPDRQKWPAPEFFWQRFRHEGVPALEKQGWEIRFAPDVGCEPLVFRSETWQAEIVEEGKGWFHLSAGFEIDGETFELQPILAALVKNRFLAVTEGLPDGQEFLIFLPDGRALVLPVGRFRRILTTLGELLDFKFSDGPVKMNALDAALITRDMQAEATPIEVDETVDTLAKRLAGATSASLKEVPPGMKATLRDYQLQGFQWMQFLSDHQLHGILADDMGLGKTIQTLTHLLAEVESGKNRGLPSLVVAPTSVVMNWQREAEKFAPDLRVLVLQGSDRHSRFRRINQADLCLTSYALLHRDIAELESTAFHLLVLDEAQHIKNPSARVSQAARRLSARSRLCLSGTPIENHLGELWSLMNFLMPGWLGPLEAFRATYQHPIERGGNEEKREALAKRLGPLILRRTKESVAKELPPKTEILHTIEMTEGQKDLYETVRSTMDKQVRDALALQGQESKIVFLDALLKLRQICCHPVLLERARDSVESAKFDYLVDLVTTLRSEGHRVLLFSQFTSMIALIEEWLVSESVSHLKLTGATQDRQSLVERFQSGEGEVFLVSLKAGGTGLTLTGADTVIHYDPWWNPAAENQATDRAYRIGQDKPVFVHKLICQNTVEERIQQMQERKDELASDLLAGASRGFELNEETLSKLLARD
ncbi:MAG: DEAD/DEAH box helicase [Verrucomicrobiota bacterium]